MKKILKKSLLQLKFCFDYINDLRIFPSIGSPCTLLLSHNDSARINAMNQWLLKVGLAEAALSDEWPDRAEIVAAMKPQESQHTAA